jgi:hypothetical protein
MNGESPTNAIFATIAANMVDKVVMVVIVVVIVGET